MVALFDNVTPLPIDQILQGDCLDVMRSLPDCSIDTVLTDPPYSSGTRREAGKGLRKSMRRQVTDDDWFVTDCLTTNGFVWLMRSCAVEWQRILKPGGHILVFIDWRMMPNLAGAIESADLRHIGLLVWNKTYFGMGSYFRNQHELILHFTKGRSSPPQRRDAGNVLNCPPIRDSSHPTEKPVELLRLMLSVVCPPVSGIVLDCFAGSGATCVAAIKEGMHYIGIERESKYVDLARSRLSMSSCNVGLWIETQNTQLDLDTKKAQLDKIKNPPAPPPVVVAPKDATAKGKPQPEEEDDEEEQPGKATK
jgi:site-specific DNA-methyltransferase (adenine-specific)